MKRLMVTGSRTWTNEHLMERVLSAAYVHLQGHKNEITLVHGGCPTGADQMADRIWRPTLRYLAAPPEVHPADWSKGKGAGFARNIEMAQSDIDLCVAFAMPCTDGDQCDRYAPWHITHGTEHAASACRIEGVPVWMIGDWS